MNSIGQELVDWMVNNGLKDDEIKLFNFLREMNNFRNKRLIKDFWDIIDQFYKYGFNENASLFSEMLRELLRQIRKYFKYEPEYNSEIETEQDIY